MENKFYVLNWDFNTDEIKHYDVLPYLRNCIDGRYETWKSCQKSKMFQKRLTRNEISEKELIRYYKVPDNFPDFKDFIDLVAQHQFWGRCEYEMICTGWPVQKNDYKIDVYEQIKMNLDIICNILWTETQIKYGTS